MKQPNWSKYEASLLLEVYFKIKQGKISRQDAIAKLSDDLRQMAINQGKQISSKYRNQNGISMRLSEIDYVLSDGENGLAHTSQLFRETIDIFNNNNALFQEILFDAHKILSKRKNSSSESFKELVIEYCDTPFFILLHINPEEYQNIEITTKLFSTRNYNTLRRNQVRTFNDLLHYTYNDLREIKNIGKTSIEQIIEIIQIVINESHNELDSKKDCMKRNWCSGSNRSFINSFITQILEENNYTVDESLDVPEKKILFAIKKAIDAVGLELFLYCYNNQCKAATISNMLSEFVKKWERKNEVLQIIKNYSFTNTSNKVDAYIDVYTQINPRLVLNEINSLRGLSFNQISETINTIDPSNDKEIIRFLKWCDFDIKYECESMLEYALKSTRDKEIIELRASNVTLNEIGEKYGFTRERVRQIEHIIIVRAGKWDKVHRLLYKIAAMRDGDYFLTTCELEEVIGNSKNEITYIFSVLPTSYQKYEKELEMFILSGADIRAQTKKFVLELPDFFTEEDFIVYLQIGCEEGMPQKLLEKEIYNRYHKTGKLFHTGRLSITGICSDMVYEFYPNGIHIYDLNEMSTFRQRICEEYGNLKLPVSDRAFQARIADSCILRDRGVYISPRRVKIPSALIEKIYRYIVSGDDVYFMGFIFAKFEDLLEKYGVDNRYFLQGVLKNKYDGYLFFKKDYVSKDKSVLSMSELVKNYIISSDYPVSKKQIFDKFLISEITINFIISDSEILNYFGKYYHPSKLRYTAEEKLFLKNLLDSFILNQEVVHVRKIYEYLLIENKDLLNKIFVDSPFALFSVLEFFFASDYEFSRPCISNKGTKIEKMSDYIRTMFVEEDVITIDDITQAYRDQNRQYGSKLSACECLSDTHFLRSQTELISIRASGITQDICAEAENIILQCISECIPISFLDCFFSLPRINIRWNEWLLYSMLLKWSNNLEVRLTSNVLSEAVPLVATKGQISYESLKKYAGMRSSS